MEKKSRKHIVIGLSVLLLIAITLIGLTYAYYRTRIVGNTVVKSIGSRSGKIEITYRDGNASFSTGSHDVAVAPGFTYSKEFSVENTGSETVNYTVVLDNVANTFKRTGDWIYTLTNKTTNEKVNGVINRLSEQTLLANISINSKVVDSYKLDVTYQSLNEDQSEDMGKLMSFRVNIKEASAWDKAPDGTLLYSLRENNEVVEPLTVPGKAPSGLYVEADGMLSEISISVANQSNRYYAYADTYTFNEESGTYSLNNPKVATYEEISTGLANKYVTSYSPDYSNTIKTTGLTQIYFITSAPAASTTSNVTIAFTPKKVSIDSITEAILSSTEDDYGTSYYFRGDVKNNYVTYSGMCWRIVRVQGDGTIKLVLADGFHECGSDVEVSEDGTYSGYSSKNNFSAFISNSKTENQPFDLDSYKYKESKLPEILTAWLNGGDYNYRYIEFYTTPSGYKEIWDEYNNTGSFNGSINLEDQKQLVSSEWCNDLSISNINNDVSEYSAASRLDRDSNNQPSLKCDFVGINNSKSEKIEDIIGVLTADEIAFAGASERYIDTNHFLKTNASGTVGNYGGYYTMTPFNNQFDWAVMNLYIAGANGSVTPTDVYAFIRPAVVLRSDVEVTTDSTSTYEVGTQQNPYVIG